MALDLARVARKSSTSGVCPPLKGFDAANRRQIGRPSDRADLHGASLSRNLERGEPFLRFRSACPHKSAPAMPVLIVSPDPNQAKCPEPTRP